MNFSNYRRLCIEIFETLNDINPSFIKDNFKLRMTNRLTREEYKLDLEIPKSNEVRFGTKSLRRTWPFLGSNKKLEWNSLLMRDIQKVKLYTFCVFFATLTKN